MANHLGRADITWALTHLSLEGDTDLFPRPFEIDVLRENTVSVLAAVQGLDLVQHKWSEPRRALILKDELAFRSGAQLDPFDSLVFAAIIKNCSKQIESHRGDKARQRIFSYRLKATRDGRLFDQDQYKNFWRTSRKYAETSPWVLVTDISDFYNQIYHHTIEQEFDSAGIQTEAKKAVVNLLKVCSVTTSRGVPVGPHASHLLAELSLRQIDEMLVQSGVSYIRFVDDFHIFCNDRNDAYRVLHRIAQTLDLVKLTLNKSKTRLLNGSSWLADVDRMLANRPINTDEESIIGEIQSVDGPSHMVMAPAKVPPSLSKLLTNKKVTSVLHAYLSEKDIDFVRMRYFLRRISQTQTPAAVEFVVENMEQMTPALADAVRYLRSAIRVYKGDHALLGDKLIGALDGPVVSSNPYITAMILSLFANVSTLDHIPKLIQVFDNLPSMAQREIVLAASNASANEWLRSLKGLNNQDPWVRRAIILSAASWSDDERRHWAKTQKGKYTLLDTLIADALTAPTTTKKLNTAVKKGARRSAKRVV